MAAVSNLEQSVGSLKGDLSIATTFDPPEISPDSPFTVLNLNSLLSICTVAWSSLHIGQSSLSLCNWRVGINSHSMSIVKQDVGAYSYFLGNMYVL
jgi:hypothetical protein